MEDLHADCTRCSGLCCVAPSFQKSSDFAFTKPAGVPCRNLATDFRCTIHSDLRSRGFTGCTVFDCFGAGQRVVAAFGDGWSGAVFEAFGTTVQLHEMLHYLRELDRRLPSPEVTDAVAAVERARDAYSDPDEVRPRVADLLGRASVELRAGLGGQDHRGADLSGRRLTDLRGAHLRGALLLGADLRDADLTRADVLGADLRGADIGGADLSDVLFLTQMQLNSTRGDGRTLTPPGLRRPAQWTVQRRAGG